MPDRHRGAGSTAPKGTAVWTFGGPLSIGGSYPIVTQYGSVDDTYCEPDNGPFHVEYGKFEGGRINGRSTDSTVWTNYIADIFEGLHSFGHTTPDGSPDDIAAATLGAKKSNPSRPYVDIPSELLQLHDIVDALRGARLGSFAKRGAGALVATDFGVNPYIEDFLKLMKLNNQIKRRVGELEKLKKRGGLRRTVKVFNGSFSIADFDQLMQSNFGYFVSKGRYCSTEEVKVHCRWYPSATFFPWEQTNHPLVDQATDALLGKTIDMATAWELIPWTWMIDWFGNVSDYLAATRNVVHATLASVTVMRHQRSEWSWSASNINGTAQCAPASAVRETKDRKLSAVFPEASLPFLSPGQMGIAAGLTILKSSDF